MQKKQYYIPVNSMPRILKRDIRREFGRMFTNVYNSGDQLLVEKFFSCFCVPSVHSIVYSQSSNSINPTIKLTKGVMPVIVLTNYRLSLIPDMIFQLRQAQIIRKSEIEGCCINLQLEINCTPLFMQEWQDNVDTNNEHIQAHGELIHFYGHVSDNCKDFTVPWVIPNARIYCRDSASQTIEEAMQYMNLENDQHGTLEPCKICQSLLRNKLLETPKSCNGKTNMKFFLDAQNRLYRMEFCRQ